MPLARSGRGDPGLSLWSSGFRPFFLLAPAYGVSSLALWFLARDTGWPAYAAVPLWHGHEMLFGFAAALVCGVLLTALPSWTGAAEVRGAPLAALIGPARRRLFWWTLPPLAAFAAANLVFHLWNSQWGLLLGVHALAFLVTLYGGLFIPAFTRRYLQARGERSAAILMPLEYATAAAMVAFAAADLLGAPAAWMAAAALVAAAVHGLRFARWRGWRTGGEPLLWCIHLGYAWLIAAVLLRAAAAFTPRVPRDAWIHAFTLGAYGMLKIGLMPRVVLRHTGRAPAAPPAMRAAFVMVLGAALLRVAYSLRGPGDWALGASALLWGSALVVFLWLYAPMLLRPSLPRR
jgi:uncharacterized protein involved in response to NO